MLFFLVFFPGGRPPALWPHRVAAQRPLPARPLPGAEHRASRIDIHNHAGGGGTVSLGKGMVFHLSLTE